MKVPQVKLRLTASITTAIALNALGLFLMMSGEETRSVVSPISNHSPTNIINKAGEPSARTYSETFQRPLFMRNRSPYVPPPPLPTAPPFAPTIIVMPQPALPTGPSLDRSVRVAGIIVDGRGSRALVLAASQPQGEWLSIGGQIGGWRLSEITREGIVLTSGDQQLSATLYPK